MGRNSKYHGIRFDRRSQNFGFHMIAWSQLIADDRRRSQKIEHGSIFCDRLRSRSQDRGRSQMRVSIWSQTIAELFAICDRLRWYGNQPLKAACALHKDFCQQSRVQRHSHFFCWHVTLEMVWAREPKVLQQKILLPKRCQMERTVRIKLSSTLSLSSFTRRVKAVHQT